MKTNLHRAIETVLMTGCAIESGMLSLCDLGYFVQSRKPLDRRFQVTSEDARFRFSEIYMKESVAIDKFIAIKNYLDGRNAVRN